MTITNNLNLPTGLIKAVDTNKHNKDGSISATTLIQGVKQIILTQRHWDELTDDVSNRIWSLFGIAVHSLLETEGENDFTEIEMAYKVEGINVTGRIDNYNMKDGIVCDYKSTSVYKIKSQNFEDWYLQGMIYSWLLHKNNLPINKCCFIAMLKDHSKKEALRNHDYPQCPVYLYQFDVTAERIADIENYILSKIKTYNFYKNKADDEIPECTQHERWAKDPVFAVMKKGIKTAVKLFKDAVEATKLVDSLGDNHYIEFRPGESIRCSSYCLCASFCSYYKAHVLCEEEKEIKQVA